jgi:hypothetical protein
MPVNARRLIRKMRGGAQAHLLECDDGCHYVVKFVNNPQHRRILVNELVSSMFLDFLGISVPKTAVVSVSREFLEENPEIYMQLGHHRQPVEPGWHFGSCYPGDPRRVTVYDFLPDVLLDKVENLNQFHGVLAFDKWAGNADARQAIFFRARLKQRTLPGNPEPPQRMGFVAEMMDHGYVFDGPHWEFVDSPRQGLYFRPQVYRQIRSYESFQPWLDRILHFPEEIVDRTFKQVPAQWVAGEEAELERLLTRLLVRRKRVPELIRESRIGREDAFPEWA